ncbi:discoidin domain-containing protein [Asaia krungthepensis]|nr:discoidin domain-containing protein [Asaia krungthepensis]
MSELIDLALGKPATQSSKHPEIVLPLSQVAGEAVLAGYGDTSFQTAAEWFPWWQVDLEQICTIERIELFNTDYWPTRNRLFSILVSEDGREWHEVFSKTDHDTFGGDEKTAYTVPFATPICTRFVRVRLDNWDHLHLKSVRVYGQPGIRQEGATRPLTPPATRGRHVVFAANYNEEDRFLPVFIENFLSYTDEYCSLVINFPANRAIPFHLLAGHRRVHVFNGKVERKKWGGTLLLGHMESYAEALHAFPDFDYFCTSASNSLFVRPFSLDQAVAHMARGNDAPVGMTRHYLIDVPLENVPRGEAWVWDNLEEAEPFRRYLIDEADIPLMSINQIEGLLAERSEWGTLHDRIAILEACDGFFANPTQKTLALEEFLPVTFFRRFGTSRFTNICHMLWEPIREVIFPDLVQFVQKLPMHMCQVKWFSRDPDSVPTAALSQPWSRALLATLTNDDTPATLHARILNRALSAHFSSALSSQEIYTPLTRAWRDDARWGRIQWIASETIGRETRERFEGEKLISGLPMLPGKKPCAWLELRDHRHQDMQFEAILSEDGKHSALDLRTGPAGTGLGPHHWSEVWGVLFLSPLQGEKAQLFRISLRRPFDYARHQLMHNVRRSDGKSDVTWMPVLEEDDGDRRHFYFLRPDSHHGEIWIGIPCFVQTSIAMEISFGVAAV